MNATAYLKELQNSRPQVYQMLRKYSEQVPTLNDNTLLRDGNTELNLSQRPPKEWVANPSKAKK